MYVLKCDINHFAGRRAGFLGSAFFAGSFFGSLLWGWISDIWGRRPVMLVGILGTIFSELLFGFRYVDTRQMHYISLYSCYLTKHKFYSFIIVG